MPSSPDSVIPPTISSLDSRSESTMTALTRAALGPLNAETYLALFERFDDRGRTFPTWNWAAGLLTVNWMLLRKMWGPALAYLAAAEGLGLVVLAVGRTWMNWPQGVEWGLLAALLLLSCAVPGLWGNTLLYNDVRKKVDRALTQSHTVQAAHELLEKNAPSQRRLRALAAINAILVLALLAAWLLWPTPHAEPASTPAVSGKVSSLPASSPFLQPRASAATASSPATSPEASAPAKEGTAEAVAAPAPPTSAPATPAAPASSQSSATAPSSTASATANSRKEAPVLAEAAASPTTLAASAQPKASAPAPASGKTSKASETPTPVPTASAARKKASAAEEPKAKAPKAKAPVASAAQGNGKAIDPLTPVGTAKGHYINVGLFADEANARKAQAKLLNEGLPAFRQELDTANGKRIRVRVGPYANRAQAEQAAQSIQALGLEAVVFQKAK